MLKETKFGVDLWRGVAKVIQGRDNEALNIFTNLLERKPDFPEIMFWLSIVYLRKGNIIKAKEMFYSIPSRCPPENISQQIQRFLSQ